MTATVGGLWDRVQGDDWSWEFTTDADISAWSGLIVSIRDRNKTGARLLATSTGDVDVPVITTSGTSYGGGVLAWQVSDTVSAGFPTGVVFVEAEVLVGGAAFTVLSAQALRVRPQLAVRP